MKGLVLSLKFNDDYFYDKFNLVFLLLVLWYYLFVFEELDLWGVGFYMDYGVLMIFM